LNQKSLMDYNFKPKSVNFSNMDTTAHHISEKEFDSLCQNTLKRVETNIKEQNRYRERVIKGPSKKISDEEFDFFPSAIFEAHK